MYSILVLDLVLKYTGLWRESNIVILSMPLGAVQSMKAFMTYRGH